MFYLISMHHDPTIIDKLAKASASKGARPLRLFTEQRDAVALPSGAALAAMGIKSKPTNDVKLVQLNDYERAMLRLLGKLHKATHDDLAKRAPFAKRARSKFRVRVWVRNSLRKLLRERLIDRLEPGKFSITPRGRSWNLYGGKSK